MNERDGVAESTLGRLAVEEEEVRDLLVEAGPRPEVPAWDLATIKAAARREWGDMVAEGHERKRLVRGSGALALAASLVLAVLLGWWWSARTPPTGLELVASVELTRGEVAIDDWVERPGSLVLAVGDRLPAGARVATGTDPETRLAVRLASGHSVRLAGGTRVRLLSDRRLELQGGAVYLDSGGAPAAGAPVEIVTPLGVVRDIGTQFEVRLEAGESVVRVRVREGKVSLDSEGASHLAVAGEELNLGRDGSVRRANVEAHGAEWEWVQRSAPSFPIEGLPLAAYLQWVSRETGLSVHWDSAALEASTSSIRLHGAIEDLTPGESLGVLLPASGLDYRIAGSTLRIMPRAS